MIGKVVDRDPLDDALRESPLDLADVLLEAADHDVLERFATTNWHTAREAVGIEQLEERREAVGVTVVRSCGEEQPVLEAAPEVANGAGELRLDPVTPAAGRGGVVRLVEDQQAARKQVPEPLSERIGICGVGQQVVRDEEATVRPPGIDAEAPFATDLREVLAIEELEHQAEALLELALPLLENRGRGRHDNRLGLLAQQQLACDQAGLDRLAEPGVVGDEEVDARETEGLAQRFHLVGVDLDPGAERRLEQVWVGGSDRAPPERVKERAEEAGVVEALRREVGPSLVGEDATVELVVPQDFEDLTLGVVVGTREADERALAAVLRDLLDEPAARPHLDELAGVGRPLGECGRGFRRIHRCVSEGTRRAALDARGHVATQRSGLAQRRSITAWSSMSSTT